MNSEVQQYFTWMKNILIVVWLYLFIPMIVYAADTIQPLSGPALLYLVFFSLSVMPLFLKVPPKEVRNMPISGTSLRASLRWMLFLSATIGVFFYIPLLLGATEVSLFLYGMYIGLAFEHTHNLLRLSNQILDAPLPEM